MSKSLFVEPVIHWHLDAGDNRASIVQCRFEFPLAHFIRCRAIENGRAAVAHDASVGDLAIDIDLREHENGALFMRAQGLHRIRRFGRRREGDLAIA